MGLPPFSVKKIISHICEISRKDIIFAALSIDSKVLRLYCLRISDQILIVGNGGVKTTRTYEEDAELSGYVMNLQKFDQLLAQELKSGKIKIEQNVITGIESVSFEL